METKQNALKTEYIWPEASWNTSATTIIFLKDHDAGHALLTGDGAEDILFASQVSFNSLLIFDKDILHFSEHNCRNSVPKIGCGGRVPQGFAAGGEPSAIGKWPWVAAIYDATKELLICGGALIREEWVLTAAHCLVHGGTSRVRNSTDFRVYLGKYYRSDSLDDGFVQKREVSIYTKYCIDICIVHCVNVLIWSLPRCLQSSFMRNITCITMTQTLPC